jgi:hypothetical protein
MTRALSLSVVQNLVKTILLCAVVAFCFSPNIITHTRANTALQTAQVSSQNGSITADGVTWAG